VKKEKLSQHLKELAFLGTELNRLKTDQMKSQSEFHKIKMTVKRQAFTKNKIVAGNNLSSRDNSKS
jgi:hypothetical protein